MFVFWTKIVFVFVFWTKILVHLMHIFDAFVLSLAIYGFRSMGLWCWQKFCSHSMGRMLIMVVYAIQIFYSTGYICLVVAGHGTLQGLHSYCKGYIFLQGVQSPPLLLLAAVYLGCPSKLQAQVEFL